VVVDTQADICATNDVEKRGKRQSVDELEWFWSTARRKELISYILAFRLMLTYVRRKVKLFCRSEIFAYSDTHFILA
jgi:hypothetical protein